MLILAHRGYHAEMLENTLAAFESAVNLGADGIETDVQVTADGLPVLFHDRLCRGEPVGTLTHVQLCERSGCQVPTLVSALDAWPDIFWNLEIKMPINPAAVWPVLRTYRTKRRLLVSSFWHPVAVHAGLELEIDCGLLVAHAPLAFDSLLVGLPDDLPKHRVAVVWECAGVHEPLIDAATACGIKNYVYGTQTATDYSLVQRGNVAGVITDEPGLAKQRLRSELV